VANEVDVIVRVQDRTRAGASSSERNVRESAERSGTAMGKFAEKAKVGGLLVGAALLKIGSDAVSAASDAQQSLGGTQAVFGKYADAVVAKSGKAAEAVGLSANQYRESANIVGSLFKGQGVAADQLAGKTDNLIKMGADLSATYGGTAADAVEALTSAYKGEFDPIERYGVSLSAAKITTEAFAVANVKSQAAFAKLSPAQQTAAKQQATTNLLLKAGKDATGQFQAQTGTLAEQTQILKAKYTDLSAQLGAKLIPIITKLLEKGIKLTGWLEKNPAVAEAAAVAVAALAAGFVALGVAMLANPVSLTVAGLVLLGAGLVAAYKKSEKFRNVVNAAFKTVSKVVLAQVDIILGVFEGLFTVLGHLPGKAGAPFRAVAKAIKATRGEVHRLQDAVNGLHGKRINVTVHYGRTGSAPDGVSGNVPIGSASGRVIGHAAGGGPQSGLTMVGEQGRELVRLAPGSRVHSNANTESMLARMAGAGGADQVIRIVLEGTGMLAGLRKEIRIKGGNVQGVLGA
jgi:hypothetical protein